jgi:hypothetical protein
VGDKLLRVGCASVIYIYMNYIYIIYIYMRRRSKACVVNDGSLATEVS